MKSAQPRKPSRSKNGAVGDRIPSPSSPKNCKRGLTKSPAGRAALERLQAERPGQYPDQLLRTLQRRLKIWRKEKAHAMVFGAMQFEPAIEPMTN
ncbi:hypothetical protein JQK88_34685 [Mesorhizobium caraganae]|uniref:hypothetical protein n=1 Tax=Mesorhizobium caraganae TaxID=483206 RepID=UPI00193AD1C8|nr:hypothetical protein [Mesorhizobium caraganae]MBM2716218.1 hypothetical protein [Mesorhizobium caraganae]